MSARDCPVGDNHDYKIIYSFDHCQYCYKRSDFPHDSSLASCPSAKKKPRAVEKVLRLMTNGRPVWLRNNNLETCFKPGASAVHFSKVVICRHSDSQGPHLHSSPAASLAQAVLPAGKVFLLDKAELALRMMLPKISLLSGTFPNCLIARGSMIEILP